MFAFFRTLPSNVIHCFRIHNLPWHLLAISLTFIAVVTGLDWSYFLATRNALVLSIAFPAVILGGVLPILIPVVLIIGGTVARHAKTAMTGWAIGQAAFLGWLISSAYKAVSGRLAPPLHGIGADISRGFLFGLWRGGIFWGWPSSHTAVAFAMAVAVFMLAPKKSRWLGVLALLFALYIGLGVSVTVHWFSDFVAGLIIGSVIGAVVGLDFRSRIKKATA